MKAQIILLLIIFCTACQSGRIPCPDVKGPKFKKVRASSKRPLEYTASISTRRDQSQEARGQASQGKEPDPRFVKNVTLEEWDCPKPGEKKYMPKSVKVNIRKNMKRIKSGEKKAESDSLRTR